MNDFTATLADFRAGHRTLADVVAAFRAVLESSPGEVRAAIAEIEQHAREGHLPPQLYQSLKRLAEAASSEAASSEAAGSDATRFAAKAPSPKAVAPESNSDATRFAAKGAAVKADARAPSPAAPAPSAESDADATRFAAKPPSSKVDADATRFAAKAAPATADTGEARSRAAPTPTAPSDAASSTPTTGSRWVEAAGAEDAPHVTPGFVLKGRFVLEQEVGRGGMGVVFRARDLRKEEAQDRDPYVAIKILNDDFRRHPESLKALQREARKAQTLAHPNIATVWDFDRDGAIVYIQMEFLQGRPLDVVTRESGAMPYREAYPLIAGMGRALSYAHGLGIVHSDFKPGNCFLIGNDAVKVFDFGIARAAKISGTQRDELTKFDAGTLGALTPAYASCEMLDGMEPDPRDDIYALGCVAYELLTGKHPFGKQPATEARAAKLSPPAVKGLTPRQQRALQRTLAFRREDRTRNVAEFLEGLGERKRNKGVLAAGIVAAGAIVAVGATLVQGVLEDRRVDALVADLGSGAAERIEPAIERYRALDPAQQTTVLNAARDPLLAYFRDAVDAAVDPAQQRYDYARAAAVLASAEELIPDSATLGAARTALLLELRQQFNEHLDAGRLLPVDGPDVTDVLETVRQVDPGNDMLSGLELMPAYVNRATAALDADALDEARALIDVGLARAPDDAPLLDLRDRLAAAVDRRASAAAAAAPAVAAPAPATEAAQRDTLAALLAAPTYNAAWETRARDVLAGLERTLPDGDTTVPAARTRIAELYVARATARRDEGRFSESLRLLDVAESFASSLLGLAAERTTTEEMQARDAAASVERARVAKIERDQSTFRAATDADDRAAANTALAELRRNLPANDPFLTTNVPAALAAMAERLAMAARDAGRLDEAEQRALEGLEAAPGNATLTTLVADLQSARARAAQPPRPAGQACTAEKAGYGSSSGGRGLCWDMIDAERGPPLVVVPSGDGFASPYAIARTETSVGLWNLYCRSSGACTPLTGSEDLPLANVTIAQARAYAEWLSVQTGARYRLPTAAEWQRAAAAPRERNDDNCVVRAAGRGGNARAATQGAQNNFGLVNYQGNVQEWTDIGGGAVEARGGSYRDPLDACEYTRGTPHDGSADAVTGFRLVREITGL